MAVVARLRQAEAAAGRRGAGVRVGAAASDAACWPLAQHWTPDGSVRKRRSALKMDSIGGVRSWIASTIHSKFVFSRNRTDGPRPSDRLPECAPCIRQRHGCSGHSSYVSCVRHQPPRVTTTLKINTKPRARRRRTTGARATCAPAPRRAAPCAGGEPIIRSTDTIHHCTLPLSPPAG